MAAIRFTLFTLWMLYTLDCVAGGAVLSAGDAGAGFQPLTSLFPATGLEVDLRLPLGGDFRSGRRLPLIARIKTATDRRIRVAVVPELWQIETQSRALGEGAAPVLDFQSLAGGSWTPPIVANAVTGAGAAGLVVPLMPVVDDIRRHLVVVELQTGDRYGKVVFRADLAPRLHELLTDERLVVQVTLSTAGGQPAGLQAAAAFPPIPATVRLPDGSSVTPRLISVAAADLPVAAAGWGSIDFVLVPDRCFAGDWNPAQQDACDRYLIAGGQAAVVVAASTSAPVACLTRWDRQGARPTSSGLPPGGVTNFPWLLRPVGFGRAAVTWLPPEISAGSETLSPAAGQWRVRWTEILAEQLAARDPRLQPRKRVDQEAYASVFDPQVARLPQRLIAQVWWVWAAVVTLFLLIGGYALKRRRAAGGTDAPAAVTEVPAHAAVSVRRWGLAAGSCVVVAGLASLYATRARISAIEWRLELTARDGAEVTQTYTYLEAWRSAGGLRLQPAGPDGVLGARAQDLDGWPLVSGLRDFPAESGRLPAMPVVWPAAAAEAGQPTTSIEAITLDSTRPLLLQAQAIAPAQAKDRMALPAMPGLPPRLSAPGEHASMLAQGDWAIVLEGANESAAPPRLPTDFTGWSLTPVVGAAGPNGRSTQWQAQPLWIQGAQLNLPAGLHEQEDIYRPVTMKWVFTQIRQITRGPVLVVFYRRSFSDCRWKVGYDTPAPVVLDDGLLVQVYALEENANR